MLFVGFDFLSKSGVKDSKHSEIIFNCLTNYRFLQLRIKWSKIGIYSLIDEFEFSIKKLSFDATKKAVLGNISFALERDKIVLVGNHQLFHSCLCSSTSLVRNKVIHENMSGAEFRSNIKVSLAMELLLHIDCGAFSHDKKLFAAGNWQSLYLYDGLSFEKILGPVTVMNERILHLEFSRDDKFVFFGRLDKWFSVQEKRVVEISQFSGNCVSYVWGSFICDGKYIAVNRPGGLCQCDRFNDDLIRWAKYELVRCPPENVEVESLLPVLDSLIRRPKSNSVETAIRYYIVCNYAEIFEGQIWNVQTGRPVLEEMLATQLAPFFYFWHIFSKMTKYPFGLCDESITLSHVALLNIWRFIDLLNWEEERFPFRISSFRPAFLMPKTSKEEKIDESSEEEKIDESLKEEKIDESLEEKISTDEFRRVGCTFTRIVHNLFPERAPVGFPYSIAKISRECYSFVNNGREIFLKDGKWLLRRKYGDKIELFERGIEDQNSLKNRSDLLSNVQDVKDCVFTDDNDALLYSTTSTSRNLYCISLVTGTKLRSITGSYPVCCSSGDGQDLGFIFSSTNESKVVLLRDLPVKFLVNSCIMFTIAVGVTFNSCDLFSLLCLNGSVCSRKIVDSSLVLSDRQMLQSELMEFQQIKFFSEKFQGRKWFFSHGGDIIVVDEGSRIVLLKRGTSIPIMEAIEGSVAYLTFSSDDSLILFCIKKINDDHYFYIWNVNTNTLTGPLCLDGSVRFDMNVDSCCFSSDNSKLFFCNAFSVLILEHEAKNAAVTTLQKRSIRSHQSDICSHCTVLCDDKLLACCIANKIVIYSVDGLEEFYKLPHYHQGKIEYCKFLCGKRYLISYGIDRLMFLFDLLAWQTIAYLRLSESCSSIAISPNEDKIVCLESPDKMSLITLRGLESDLI